MYTRHENRTGRDRRQLDPDSGTNREIERRWSKDQRSHAVDEELVYPARPAVSEDYWETLSNIPSEDCK